MRAELKEQVVDRQAGIYLISELAELIDRQALHLGHVHANERGFVTGFEYIKPRGGRFLNWRHDSRSPTGAGVDLGGGAAAFISRRIPVGRSSVRPRCFFTS